MATSDVLCWMPPWAAVPCEVWEPSMNATIVVAYHWFS